MTALAATAEDLDARLAELGFAYVPSREMRRRLDRTGSLADWAAFAESWNDLGIDTYMGDGGRYRRRRHAVYRVERDGTIERQPHQPHYQTLDFNALNGGVERWFEPVTDAIGGCRSLRTVIDFCRSSFGALSPETKAWHVEIHQFRIEAKTGEAGKPTPEGMHRDGVDNVLVLLVKRQNIVSGTTTIADLDKRALGSFTLTEPFDSAIVDDARVYHGVTPVEPLDPAEPAYRDVLVVTFRKVAA